jgi:hypothetical protein
MTASLSFGNMGPALPHLSKGEIADLRADVEGAFEVSDGKTGFPFLGKVTAGKAISLGGVPQAAAVAGAGFTQGQVKAALTKGTGTASLAFTANRPGTPGNAISVEIVQGVGSLAISVTSQKITVTLAAAGSTANAVKAAVDAHATAKTMVQVVSGGTGTVLVSVEALMTGGVGAGLEVKVNSIEQQVVGSVTDTAIPMVVSDLTGCVATDAATLQVKSNGVASNALTLGIIA